MEQLMGSGEIKIASLDNHHRPWVGQLLEDSWGSTDIVTRGKVYDSLSLPGFVAFLGDQPGGVLIYRPANNECEIIALNSLNPGVGIGTSLLSAIKKRAADLKCTRIWLITTNDNMAALRFYQKRGYRLVAVYPDALETTRKLKPSLSFTGIEGIPLRDEIELELIL